MAQAHVLIVPLIFFFLTFIRHNSHNNLYKEKDQGSKNVKKQNISSIYGFNPFGLCL